MNNKRPYATLETLFSLMLVVPMLFLFGLYYAHVLVSGIAVALLCGVSILIGGIGTIAVIVLRHFALKRNPGIISTGVGSTSQAFTRMSEGDTAVWSVDECNMRADYWRCNLYAMMHRRQRSVNLLLTPVIFSGVLALPVMAWQPRMALVIVFCVFFAWTCYVAYLLWRDMMRRYPRPESVREITTTLTRMGFEDIIGDRQAFVPWTEVIEVREHRGDVYLWCQGNKGSDITRKAFRNVLEAREFTRKATELWKNPMPMPERLRETPEAAYQPTVWPPPPRV